METYITEFDEKIIMNFVRKALEGGPDLFYNHSLEVSLRKPRKISVSIVGL
jgi:hypothetical protein